MTTPERPEAEAATATSSRDASLYLDLLKRALLGETVAMPRRLVKRPKGGPDLPFYDGARERGYELVTREGVDEATFREGRAWPADALTMVGRERLDNLHACVEDVLERGVHGDLIETGVWRGGAAMLMRAVLKARGATDRRVWVADSFAGVPPPDERYPADQGDKLHIDPSLAVDVETVRSNFKRYGLLDDRVRFVEGWFKDTLPALGDQRWALVRLDGDLYESTMDGLTNLYPNLEVGGYLIVDDYGAMPPCREAVHDYRQQHEIAEEIVEIDWTGVYWRRER